MCLCPVAGLRVDLLPSGCSKPVLFVCRSPSPSPPSQQQREQHAHQAVQGQAYLSDSSEQTFADAPGVLSPEASSLARYYLSSAAASTSGSAALLFRDPVHLCLPVCASSRRVCPPLHMSKLLANYHRSNHRWLTAVTKST